MAVGRVATLRRCAIEANGCGIGALDDFLKDPFFNFGIDANQSDVLARVITQAGLQFTQDR